jgi:hypothetical protein
VRSSSQRRWSTKPQAGPAPVIRNATQGAGRRGPFQRITTAARDLAVFSNPARVLNGYGSKPAVGSRPNLYQSYPPPSCGADPRSHRRAALHCTARSTLRYSKARLSSPVSPDQLLTTTRWGNLNWDSQIIQAVAQPVSPPDPAIADPPPQHLYTQPPHGMPPFRSATPAPAPDHPTEPTPPMSFQGIRESITWLSENGRTQSPGKLPVRPRNEFPPGIPQRVALQQSPPLLRRPHHLVKPKMLRATLNLYRVSPGIAKPLARAHSYWHNGNPN